MYNGKIDKSYSSIVPYEFDLLRPKFWTFSVKICGFGVQIRETSVRTCQKHGTLSFITSCVACFGKLMTP
jgi:hypothetical protein